jgi:hypothetical protein
MPTLREGLVSWYYFQDPEDLPRLQNLIEQARNARKAHENV